MPQRPVIPAAPTRNSHLPPDAHMPAVGIALITCLPLGLVALCHSRRVARCWQVGDREGARRASQAAWGWCLRAMVVPALLFVLFLGYWGWVALMQDYRTFSFNSELQEMLPGAEEDEVEEGTADEEGGE